MSKTDGPHRLAALVAAALSLTLSAAAQAAAPFAPGEVLVQFKPAVTGPGQDAALARVRGAVRERIETRVMRDRGVPGITRLATSMSVEDAVAELRRNPDVAFAEPNYWCEHETVSNDTYYSNGLLWGMYGSDSPNANGPAGTTNAFGCNAEATWGAGNVGSSGVYVGVVDEGVQFTHPDLDANIWTNPFDPADGVDNDGNGYVDDVHGWDFVNRDNTVFDGASGSTVDRHATHVSGTIGGEGGNALGVAGVNWHVTIIPAKFLGPSGGLVSDAIKAIDYVTDMKTRHGLNIVATNNSWASSSYSQSLHDAIIRAAKQNILTICAAGNAAVSNETNACYPANYDTSVGTSTQTAASYDGVISVAAIDSQGNLASFSNFGATKVDLGAPGVSTLSCIPMDSYASMSGTSMATPHVTGAAALYAAANPGATAAQIKAALLAATVPTAALSGKCVTGGRLDVSGAAFRQSAHDIAVTSVTVPSSVTQGTSATVSVLVQNQGTTTDTFTLSVSETPPSGGVRGTFTPTSRFVTLAAGASSTQTFTWNTAGATAGLHSVTVTSTPLTGESDVSDNSRTAMSSVTAPNTAPTIASITPSTMRQGTTISVTVLGTNIAQGATLTFQNGTAGTPIASGVTVTTDGTTLRASVHVAWGGTSANRYWDVVVTNPNGQSARLTRIFVVTR